MTELATGTERGQNVDSQKPVLTPESAKPPAAPAIRRQIRSIFPAGYFARLSYCWDQGIDSRISGQFRVSPYYEDLDADLFWYAGFDGMSFEAASQLFRDQHTESQAKHVDISQDA